jgi:type II secretory ATPase GspE/PulE/Tfp pilus assembly ATPase PilB-like protein
MSTVHRKLRQILTRAGTVDDAAFDQAIAVAEKDRRPVTEILTKQGVVKPARLLGVIARELGLTPLDVSRVAPDADCGEWFPEEFARKYQVCPISRIGSCITVAMSDPYDIVKVDQLRLETRCDVRPVVALEESVQDAIQRAYGAGVSQMAELLEGMNDDDVELRAEQPASEAHDISDAGEGSPALKLVNVMVYQAIRDKASDIHIEPFEKEVLVRFRLDGMLKEVLQPPKAMAQAIVSRIKIMAGLDIAERRKPQDGKFQVKVEGRQIDFRVSILPVVHGEKAVLRILDQSNLALKLESLGFESKCLEDYRRAIKAPYGMILITGPTGSGKSTTLYSAIHEIQSPDTNIVTVEDPVEYQIHGVNQVPVNPKREMTFGAALRSILRQDPDVILIGEIRDKETIEIAVKAALTGHLVLSTLHTNDALGAVARLVNMGVEPHLIAASLALAGAQRLPRKVCPACRETVHPSKEIMEQLGLPMDGTYMKGKGCKDCRNTGLDGRIGLLESIPMTLEMRRWIEQGASTIKLREAAHKAGFLSLREHAVSRAAAGVIPLEEVARTTVGYQE